MIGEIIHRSEQLFRICTRIQEIREAVKFIRYLARWFQELVGRTFASLIGAALEPIAEDILPILLPIPSAKTVRKVVVVGGLALLVIVFFRYAGRPSEV
jgi:hypothetical protein